MQIESIEIFILALVFTALGILNTFFPHVVFELKERWKTEDFWSEPSEGYVIITRLSGIGFLIGAFFLFAVSLGLG